MLPVKFSRRTTIFHPIISYDYIQFWNGSSDREEGEAIASCACNINIVNPSFRFGTGSSGGLLSQQRDPQGNSYGREIFLSGDGINTDVGKERKNTRELLAKSTLGTGLPCLKKDRLGQGGFSFAIAIIEPVL